MKRRYLFPLLYIALDACLWLSPWTLIAYVLSIPSIFVMMFITKTIGFPRDPAVFSYFVVVGTILQMYVLGLLWELLVWSVEKLVRRKRVAAASMSEIVRNETGSF